jgi:hypothetical protein
LQHEVLVFNARRKRQQVKQNGAGDVVGQVAANSDFDSTQRASCAKSTFSTSDSITESCGCAQARSSSITVSRPRRSTSGCVSAPARPDLDHGLTRARVDGAHDGVEHGRVG